MTSDSEYIDTLVIGAGQAGIAASEHLTQQGVPHLVLEKNRIAEAWRTRRWDSLVANGPAWHDRFPNMTFANTAADGFAPKEEVASYMEAYAEMIKAPIKTGVEVKRVIRESHHSGFFVETNQGNVITQRIIVATGPFQTPVIPPLLTESAAVTQLHSAHYHRPDQLDDGAVLVIGAGSSGVQIADELNASGKKVYLSVGAHDRPPRQYRGRDFCWWLGVLGLWNSTVPTPGREHVTIAVSGAHGGRTIDFRKLANQGIHLVGMTDHFEGNKAFFKDDLVGNVERGDQSLLSMLKQADEYIERNGLDLPEEPEAHEILPDPECMQNPTLDLDLQEAGITTVIWATGYSRDYRWLEVDTFDTDGNPQHQRGVGKEPGIYFLGLPWLSRRGSSFIWGAWHDARYVVDQIAIQRSYEAYEPPM